MAGTGTAYAFVDYDDKRDAEDAIRRENNREVEGQRIVVEWAHGPKRGFGEDQCYTCGKHGHFAKNCRSGGSQESYGRSRFDGGRGRGRGRGGWRGGGGGDRGGGFSRRRYSRSRSKERYRKRSRDRSDSGERKSSFDRRSRSRSPDKEQRDRSRSRNRSRSRSRGRDDGADGRHRQNANGYEDD
ncbi:uncharacterized protein [Apostichopus japonicus]|uniref:uncharacterized protein n=1 Tax=Stichopus japonicus TaxID=307972 RepID=UPI003AB750DA